MAWNLHAIEQSYGDDVASMAWGVRNLISTQVYAPAPAGPTSSLELRAARGRLAEDSAFILTNRSHPTALRRASVTERALYFTAAVQAVGASERDGAGAAGVAGRVHGCCASSRRDRRRRGPLQPTMCETGGLDRGATCERTDDVLLHVAVPHQKQ